MDVRVLTGVIISAVTAMSKNSSLKNRFSTSAKDWEHTKIKLKSDNLFSTVTLVHTHKHQGTRLSKNQSMQENDPNNDIPFYDNNSAQAAICLCWGLYSILAKFFQWPQTCNDRFLVICIMHDWLDGERMQICFKTILQYNEDSIWFILDSNWVNEV